LIRSAISTAPRKAAVRRLIEARVRRKELVPVAIEGAGKAEHWAQPETLDTIPERAEDIVHILSPFDPLIIQRKRLALFFDYEHRFEAYLPKEKRVFGYFALPVLVGDAIVAAVDLKTDREKRKLEVKQWTWVWARLGPIAQAADREGAGPLRALPARLSSHVRELTVTLRRSAPSPLVGEGWGGGVVAARSASTTTTPTPNPSPQGGGEQAAANGTVVPISAGHLLVRACERVRAHLVGGAARADPSSASRPTRARRPACACARRAAKSMPGMRPSAMRTTPSTITVSTSSPIPQIDEALDRVAHRSHAQAVAAGEVR